MCNLDAYECGCVCAYEAVVCVCVCLKVFKAIVCVCVFKDLFKAVVLQLRWHMATYIQEPLHCSCISLPTEGAIALHC